MKTKAWVALLLLCFSTSVFAVDKHHKHHKHYNTKKYAHKHAKGLKRSETSRKFLKATKKVSYLHADSVVPGAADISAKVSLPENQAQCGACWDFSLTKALRSAWMVAGKDPGVLEFNYLLNNCGPGPSMYGCNGGDFDAAQSFENGAGPGLNASNPYTQRGGSCANLPVAATAVSYQMLGTGNSGPTFKDLAYATGVQGQMLSIDVAAGSGDWENYSEGIYDGCSGGANQIDHMIDLVGYDCETSKDASGNCSFDASGEPVNGDGYLIVENNWGETWGTQAANGHGGYMKTRFKVQGQNCNAIATDALQYTISAPVPVPPVPPVPPTPPTPPTPVVDNIPWWVYVGFGLAGIAVVALLILLLKKK
jgi:C1A family cysteine protease